LRANFNINLSSFLNLFLVIILFCFASCILSFKSSICLMRAFRCSFVNNEVFEEVEESAEDNEADDEDGLNEQLCREEKDDGGVRGGVTNSAVDLAATNTAGDDDDIGVISAVLTDAILVLVTDDVLTVPADADAELLLLLLLLSKLRVVSTVATVVGVDVTLLLSFLPLKKYLFLFLYEDDFNIPRWGELVG
jgi:hypothetical protein